MDRYNKYQTKQCTHTLHTQHMVASTWLGDHQGRPSTPTNSLHKLHMAQHQVLLTNLLTYLRSPLTAPFPLIPFSARSAHRHWSSSWQHYPRADQSANCLVRSCPVREMTTVSASWPVRELTSSRVVQSARWPQYPRPDQSASWPVHDLVCPRVDQQPFGDR